MDLEQYIARQINISTSKFGPGQRTGGLLDHLRKELAEIEAEPTALMEWCDVVILALDGAWRAGWTPEQIAEALGEKQLINAGREWPDWRQLGEDVAIEHIRE